MGGIAAGGWWGHRGRGGGAGMVRLCWVWPWGALGEKEVGDGEESVGGSGTGASFKELTGRKGA